MLLLVAKIIMLLFGLFLIGAGFLMLLRPVTARNIVAKAGSTNLINYAEISLRMLPAAAMIVYAEYTSFPLAFTCFGWFMLVTSLILFCIPRKLHHSFSRKSAEMLKPGYFQIISPFSVLLGVIIIFQVI